MDVIFCTSEFPPGPGGIGCHAYALAREFFQRGASVHVIAPARKDFDHKQFDETEPFDLVRYNPDSSFLSKIFVHFRFLWRNRKKESSVILSGSAQQLLSIFIRLFYKAKVIHVLHGHEILMTKGIKKRLLVKALKKGDHLVAVSEFSKRELSKNGIVLPVAVIPNGVYLKDSLSDVRKIDSPVRLITVGSITQRKGQLNVIRALPYIKEELGPVEYHMVGIPAQKDLILNAAKDLDVCGEVFIHGVLSDTEKDSLMMSSHVFMMLSENLPNGDVEGFGIAVLEANACGIPAIGSAGTGVEQSINHGSTGLLVNPHDPFEISKAVKTVISNYSRFSENSRQWASRHSWKIIADSYWKVMQS